MALERGHCPVPNQLLVTTGTQPLSQKQQPFNVLFVWFLPDFRIKYFLTLGLTDWSNLFYRLLTDIPRILSCFCFSNIKCLEHAHSNSRALFLRLTFPGLTFWLLLARSFPNEWNNSKILQNHFSRTIFLASFQDVHGIREKLPFSRSGYRCLQGNLYAKHSMNFLLVRLYKCPPTCQIESVSMLKWDKIKWQSACKFSYMS